MSAAHILLAEDSAFDARDFHRRMRTAATDLRITTVTDGCEVISLLDPASPLRLDPLPDLVVLDCNMPRLNGLEVLSFIRGEPSLAGLKVVILTTSNASTDAAEARALAADAFLLKHLPAEALVAEIEAQIDRTGSSPEP